MGKACFFGFCNKEIDIQRTNIDSSPEAALPGYVFSLLQQLKIVWPNASVISLSWSPSDIKVMCKNTPYFSLNHSFEWIWVKHTRSDQKNQPRDALSQVAEASV